jgi:hypothetical protein
MPRNKWGHAIHRYMRVEQGTRVLWRCTMPNCRHFLVGEMVVGQLTKCNRCNIAEFQMKKAHLSYKRPHCVNCTKGYRKAIHEDVPIATIMENLDTILKG